jgi:hypothetical protein
VRSREKRRRVSYQINLSWRLRFLTVFFNGDSFQFLDKQLDRNSSEIISWLNGSSHCRFDWVHYLNFIKASPRKISSRLIDRAEVLLQD